MTNDYSLTLQDSTGRTVVLHIAGASVDSLVSEDFKVEWAKEEVESNAFGNAIANGQIGEDATLV